MRVGFSLAWQAVPLHCCQEVAAYATHFRFVRVRTLPGSCDWVNIIPEQHAHAATSDRHVFLRLRCLVYVLDRTTLHCVATWRYDVSSMEVGGFAVHAQLSHVLVTEWKTDRILEYTMLGQLRRVLRCSCPRGLLLDTRRDVLFVAEWNQQRLALLSYTQGCVLQYINVLGTQWYPFGLYGLGRDELILVCHTTFFGVTLLQRIHRDGRVLANHCPKDPEFRLQSCISTEGEYVDRWHAYRLADGRVTSSFSGMAFYALVQLEGPTWLCVDATGVHVCH